MHIRIHRSARSDSIIQFLELGHFIPRRWGRNGREPNRSREAENATAHVAHCNILWGGINRTLWACMYILYMNGVSYCMYAGI